MGRLITATIANTPLTFDHDAYMKLSAYLNSVKAYFQSQHGIDIMETYEEKVVNTLMTISKGNAYIAQGDVELMITQLGDVDHIEEKLNASNSRRQQTKGRDTSASQKSTHRQQQTSVRKRLYRNKEEGMIAGVCSGIAAYTGLPVKLVRILAALFFFMGGAAVPLYIILMLAIPYAKTDLEKEAMYGDTFNSEEFSEKVETEIEDLSDTFEELKHIYKKKRKMRQKVYRENI